MKDEFIKTVTSAKGVLQWAWDTCNPDEQTWGIESKEKRKASEMERDAAEAAVIAECVRFYMRHYKTEEFKVLPIEFGWIQKGG